MHRLARQPISSAEFDALFQEATILRHGRKHTFKVARTAAGRFIKCFYYEGKRWHRRYLNTAAGDFVAHANQLHQRGVTTVIVDQWYRCPEKSMDVLSYQGLPGISVKDHIEKTGDRKIFEQMAEFVSFLHSKKIYFRAGHLDNYLYLPNGKFALIDVSNTRFYIDCRKRAKNLFYLYSHEYKLDSMQTLLPWNEFQDFLKNYLAASNLCSFRKTCITLWLRYYRWQLLKGQ